MYVIFGVLSKMRVTRRVSEVVTDLLHFDHI